MTSANSTKVDVSVTICTYNGADRVLRVLESLMNQNVPDDISWEIVAVDNNSKDHTFDVLESFREKSPVPYKVVKEAEQGLVYARRRALQETAGDIVSFLDDDTTVSPCWVHVLNDFFQSHELAGLVGPRISAVLDVPPPEYFNLIKAALAITDSGDKTLNYTELGRGHPIFPHAGCRRVAIAPLLIRDKFDVTGRCAEKLTSCEDSVLAYGMRAEGWQWWYEPKLEMEHHIPQYRLSRVYLRKLMAGMGASAAEVKRVELGRELTYWDILRQLHYYGSRYLYHASRYTFAPTGNVRGEVSYLLLPSFVSAFRSYARLFNQKFCGSITR